MFSVKFKYKKAIYLYMFLYRYVLYFVNQNIC